MDSFRLTLPPSAAVIRHAVSGLAAHDVQSYRAWEEMRLLTVFLSPDDSDSRYDFSFLQHVSVATIVCSD